MSHSININNVVAHFNSDLSGPIKLNRIGHMESVEMSFETLLKIAEELEERKRSFEEETSENLDSEFWDRAARGIDTMMVANPSTDCFQYTLQQVILEEVKYLSEDIAPSMGNRWYSKRELLGDLLKFYTDIYT